MRVTMITFCLIGAAFANPISFNAILGAAELDPNSTESLSLSQSSENYTAVVQSLGDSTSSQSQSSESESLESTSEDTTSEESDSQSDESNSMAETRDDTMGSEENVRKSVQLFASVLKDLSAEDNSSTEVGGQSVDLTQKQPIDTATSITEGQTGPQLVENPTGGSDTTSESLETSDITGAAAATGESSESTSSESNETIESNSNESNETSVSNSSESNETIESNSNESNTTSESNSSESNSSESNETSEVSDSSEESNSAEDSNAGNSTVLGQIKAQDCVNGTQSCESEEYFFQDVGDDAFYSVDNLMVPDEGERELSLRR